MRKKVDFLEEAIKIATKYHTGQKDKANAPYILHCLRVMLKGKNEDEMITGVLHDTVEDTRVTIEFLQKRGFPKRITNAVNCLTKRDGISHEKYLAGIMKNKLAMKVKLNDLEDNMNLLRLKEVKEKDVARLNKYIEMHGILTRKIC